MGSPASPRGLYALSAGGPVGRGTATVGPVAHSPVDGSPCSVRSTGPLRCGTVACGDSSSGVDDLGTVSIGWSGTALTAGAGASPRLRCGATDATFGGSTIGGVIGATTGASRLWISNSTAARDNPRGTGSRYAAAMTAPCTKIDPMTARRARKNHLLDWTHQLAARLVI